MGVGDHEVREIEHVDARSEGVVRGTHIAQWRCGLAFSGNRWRPSLPPRRGISLMAAAGLARSHAPYLPNLYAYQTRLYRGDNAEPGT